MFLYTKRVLMDPTNHCCQLIPLGKKHKTVIKSSVYEKKRSDYIHQGSRYMSTMINSYVTLCYCSLMIHSDSKPRQTFPLNALTDFTIAPGTAFRY